MGVPRSTGSRHAGEHAWDSGAVRAARVQREGVRQDSAAGTRRSLRMQGERGREENGLYGGRLSTGDWAERM